MEYSYWVYSENATNILSFIAVLLVVYISTRKPEGIPPGSPFTLPVLGDLPLLYQGDILKAFANLRERYGDIFSFYMGKELIIVINGFELIQKAGIRKGDIFMDRPQNFLTNATRRKSKGIVFTSGKFWKTQRKFTQTCLQNLSKSSFDEKILREVERFISVLKEQNGRSYDIQEAIHISVANVILSILCGKHHDYDDTWVKTYLDKLATSTKVIMRASLIMQCLPFLKHLPGDVFQIKVNDEHLDFAMAYVNSLYDEHVESHNADNIRDFMDAYISEIKRRERLGETGDFTKDQLGRIMVDLIGAGTGSTATIVRWALLYLLHNPELNKRLQEDIDAVTVDNRLPRLADRSKLPLVEAFILETLRFANVAPLAFPHCIAGDSDIIFEGYKIPNKSSIMFNIGTVLFDPGIFQNPLVFNPERFLDGSGQVIKPKELISFGLGRRVCLGEAMARMFLFLFMSAMIKEFNFLPESDKLPDLKGVFTLSNSPVPFKVKAIRRKTKSS